MKYTVINTRQKVVVDPQGQIYSIANYPLKHNDDPAHLLFINRTDAERIAQRFVSPKFKVVEIAGD